MHLVHDATDAALVRLDVFLSEHVAELSRRRAQSAIAEGAVRVNGRGARKAQLVAPGDHVEILDAALEPPQPAVDSTLSMEVVYEDAALVVVDKPAGVPTLALHDGEAGTVASFMRTRYPEVADVGGPALEAGIAHRLDNDTSGLVVAARTARAYASLRAQFAERLVVKEYTALVRGHLREERTIHALIAPAGRRGDRMEVVDRGAAGGRNAETTIRVLEHIGAATLVAVRIRTGVRHQIRVHLGYIGHPIVGDRLYGGGDDRAAARHLLHACFLELDHPQRGIRLDLRSPLPADFREAMRRIAAARHRRRRN